MLTLSVERNIRCSYVNISLLTLCHAHNPHIIAQYAEWHCHPVKACIQQNSCTLRLVIGAQPLLEHSYSDLSNLIGQFEVPYFHSDTVEGTTCSALALRAWLFYM